MLVRDLLSARAREHRRQRPHDVGVELAAARRPQAGDRGLAPGRPAARRPRGRGDEQGVAGAGGADDAGLERGGARCFSGCRSRKRLASMEPRCNHLGNVPVS